MTDYFHLVFWKFIHVVAYISTLFLLLLNNIPFYWIYHIMFFHSSDDVHLGCFYFLAIRKNAMMDIIQNFVWAYLFISLDHIPKSRIAESYNYVFNFFEELPNSFPQWLFCFMFPLAMHRLQVSSNPHQHLLYVIFSPSQNLILQLPLSLVFWTQEPWRKPLRVTWNCLLALLWILTQCKP